MLDVQFHPLPDDCVGRTVVYHHPGIYGSFPRQDVVGVIVGVRLGKYGRTYDVDTPGFNLRARGHQMGRKIW